LNKTKGMAQTFILSHPLDCSKTTIG